MDVSGNNGALLEISSEDGTCVVMDEGFPKYEGRFMLFHYEI